MLIGQDVLPPFGLKEARPVYHADALVVFAENEQVKTDAAIPEQSFRKRNNAFDPAAAKKFLADFPVDVIVQPFARHHDDGTSRRGMSHSGNNSKDPFSGNTAFFPEKERAQGRIIADLIGQIPIPGPRGYAAKDFIRLFSSGNRRRLQYVAANMGNRKVC